MIGKYWLTRDDVNAILIACGVAILIITALWVNTSVPR
jgi:hypothetical protein